MSLICFPSGPCKHSQSYFRRSQAELSCRCYQCSLSGILRSHRELLVLKQAKTHFVSCQKHFYEREKLRRSFLRGRKQPDMILTCISSSTPSDGIAGAAAQTDVPQDRRLCDSSTSEIVERVHFQNQWNASRVPCGTAGKSICAAIPLFHGMGFPGNELLKALEIQSRSPDQESES